MGSLNQNILDFYNSKEYQELQQVIGQKTVFSILNIERNENRHSSFLCWLLNNNESHGLGDIPLKKLLRLYATKVDTEVKLQLLSGNYTVCITEICTEKTIDNKRRIDIWAKLSLVGTKQVQPLALIIENKIDSKEHGNQTKAYHDWWENKSERLDKEIPVEIFLTPYEDDVPSCQSFVNISYTELLKNVILPLAENKMSDTARLLLSDYIRTLSEPGLTDSKEEKNYSTIVNYKDIDNEYKDLLSGLVNEHTNLIAASILAGRDKYLDSYKKKITDYLYRIEMGEQQNSLLDFWHANEKLLLWLSQFVSWDQIEEFKDVDNDEFNSSIIRTSNRDNTKYLVAFRPGEWMNNGKPTPKSQTSFLIFKAYCEKWKEENPDGKLTIEVLREKFDVKLNTYYHNRFLNYLFYDFSKEVRVDVESHPLYGRENGVIRKGTFTWDFYWDNEHQLPTAEGEVRSVKMWRKDDFENLVKRAKELGINVKPQD